MHLTAVSILILMWNPCIFASDSVFSFGKNRLEFTERDGVILSKSCLEPESNRLKCDVLDKIKKASLKTLKRTFGGQNPGAVACETQLGGIIVLGVDDEGNELTFCRFEDGSLVSTSSIRKVALENDIRPKK